MAEKLGHKQAWKWVLAACVSLAFVAARVLGAYWMQYSVNGDYSIVVLMARRMAQGLEFPLFFYGQAYMGSLEPMLSAMLCRLFGFSGFTVCMGTVAFSVAMIPFIYLLGRSAGGWQAGMAAVLFCVIGPSEFYQYTASPRGGYAALIFFTIFILWAVLMLIWRELSGKRCRLVFYAGTGFAGGIACWVDPLVAPAIIAGALLYMLVLRGKAFRNKGPYAAAGGFFAGLLPFIIWNVQNNWQSLDFLAYATHSIDFSKGLRFFFLRCAALLDLQGLPWYLMLPLACIYAASFVFLLVGFAKSWHRARWSLTTLSRGLLALFIIVFAVCFSYSDISSVRTPRDLLPLVPAIGLTLGLSVAMLKRRRKQAAIVVLVVLCVFQGTRLKVFWDMKKDSDLKLEQAGLLSEYLVEKEVRHLYGTFHEQYLNYFLDERILFCNTSNERYLPYAEAMEKASDAAIIGGNREVDDLLRALRADHLKKEIAGYEVWHDIERKNALAGALPAESIVSVNDFTGAEVKSRLFDRCLLSGWSAHSSPDRPVELVMTFVEPLPVSGFRMVCRPGQYPGTWAMYGRGGIDGPWTEMIADTDVSPFFWSGMRLYSKGLFYRIEGAAEATLCKQVKLVFSFKHAGAGMRISELQLFSRTVEDTLTQRDIEELAFWLERAGIVRVYADRWESNQLEGRFNCIVYRDTGFAAAGHDDGIPLSLDRVTAMVVNREDAGFTRGVLSGYGVTMLETNLGPWTIFHFRDEQWSRDYSYVNGMIWAGFGAVAKSQKHRGLVLAGMAERGYERDGASAKVVEQMHSAIQVYGNYRPGVGLMSAWLKESGREREAAFWSDIFENMWRPTFSAHADFGRRAVLLGVTPEKINVTPGSTFRMKYFWKCKPMSSVRELAVFVHFRRGKDILFQDDRPFLEEMDILFQPYDEILVEDRLIVVPYDIESGDCEVWVGLVDKEAHNNRLSVRTDLMQRRKAVRLPLVLHINGK